MSTASVELAQRQLEDLLTFFGVNPEVTASFEGEVIELSVSADSTGRLIGKHGETLQAIQHLLNSMLKGRIPAGTYVSVDIAGYKQALAVQLAERARKAASRAVETGTEVVLPPLNAAERRLVHAALTDVDGVRSESRGEGRDRRLVVVPEATA